MPSSEKFRVVSAAPWLLLTILVIFLDQYSKIWVLNHFEFNQPMYLLPVLNIYLDFNTGAAFSFLSSHPMVATWLFGGIAFTASILLLFYLLLFPTKSHFQSCALSLILGGAVGNLIDRIRLGHVVDFIQWHVDYPYLSIFNSVFNVADAAVFLGTVFLLFTIHLGKK